MKTQTAVLAGALLLVPLVVYLYRRRAPKSKDRLEEKQAVRTKKEKILKTITIPKDDVRFVIGRGGCVIRDIEGRCSVKIVFPEDTHRTEQIVSIKGDCNDDIADAIEMIRESCQLKPQILTEQIELRADYCGKVIGKGGDNLRDIREKSGTRIMIGREPVQGNPDMRICSIEGTRDEIEVAKELIDGNIMTELEIRRRREHRQAVKNLQSKDEGRSDGRLGREEESGANISSTSSDLCILPETPDSDAPDMLAQSVEDSSDKYSSGLLQDGENNNLIVEEVLNGFHYAPPTPESLPDICPENMQVTSKCAPETKQETVRPTKSSTCSHTPDSTFKENPVILPVESFEGVDFNTGISEFTTMSSDLEEYENLNQVTSLAESGGFDPDDSFESESSVPDVDSGVRTDLKIDTDVKKVVVKTEITASPLLEGVCLPSLAPNVTSQLADDIGSESVETLVPGTPPSSMFNSLSSVTSAGSNTAGSSSAGSSSAAVMLNKQMTLDLKSMLGISQLLAEKDKTAAALSEASSSGDATPTDARDCTIYSYYTGGCVPDEGTEAVVTNAQCSNHLWIADRRNTTFSQSDEIKRIVASSRLNNLVPVIEINEQYLFFDGSLGTQMRVHVLHSSGGLVQCWDIDTGVLLTVPLRCLLEMPKEIADIPPAAICVSTSGEPCERVHTSDLVGETVVIMGANKEHKYPRVTLHCGDQIVYGGSYRTYVTTPKPADAASLPNGSSLVYLSAIHNAGHFYVQVCGKNISELDHLEREMAEYYGSVEELPERSWSPLPGQLCGVWHRAEQIWLRGQVKELDNSDMLYIKYLDYGDTVHVPRSHTRNLRSEFKQLPYQAIECFLADAIPITTRQWTPDATAKFDALTQCGQWYPLRCVVVGERHNKPSVELYDHPYSDKEYSVGECLCAMDYARSSKQEKPAVQTLSTPIPSFASGAAYLVSPDFEDIDDELEELFAGDDDSDSADSDDFPMSRANVSNLLMSLNTQLSPELAQWKKKQRPNTCGQAKNNAFMERKLSAESDKTSSEQTTPKAVRKGRFPTQDSISDSDSLSMISESDQSNLYETPLAASPKSTTSSYASAAEFNSTFVAAETPTSPLSPRSRGDPFPLATPLHLSSAEDTDCGG